MRTILIFLILLLNNSQVFGQKLTSELCVGSWEVVDSWLIPEMDLGLDDEGKKKTEEMRSAIVGTTFTFKANGNFNLELPDDIPKFMKELKFLNRQKWKIENDQIRIGTGKEKLYNLMGIMVLIQDGKTVFILDETPFVLEVQKM